MDTNQIYDIVNGVVAQALGSEQLTAVDTQGLVQIGNSVLSSQSNTEAFLDTLVQRIGRTIISYRKYTNKLGDMVLTDFEWGMILQKIKVKMPDVVEDDAYDLVDGQSLDHYIIGKPQTTQKLFVARNPYSLFVTISRKLLKEAFLSESAMGAFLSAVFGEVRNKIELSFENLGRLCMANYIAEIAGGAREIKLLTKYQELNSAASGLTAATALLDNGFLRYAAGVIKTTSKRMTDMSVLYNDGSETRHTPVSDQRLRLLVDFENAMETQVEYAAFHEKYVSLNGTYTSINFWQSAQTPGSVIVERASDGTKTTVENIVGLLADRDAMGLYKEEEDVLTTPVNARGMYYNTFWHLQRNYLNDLSENAVIFTLN